MEKIENLIAEIEKLTVLELADLVKAIEEKFGVSAAAAAVVAAPGAAAGAPASEFPQSGSAVSETHSAAAGSKSAHRHPCGAEMPPDNRPGHPGPGSPMRLKRNIQSS